MNAISYFVFKKYERFKLNDKMYLLITLITKFLKLSANHQDELTKTKSYINKWV